MNGYPPHKMLPKCAVAPFWGYIFECGKPRTLGFRPQTTGQKRVAKDHHKKRCRRYAVDDILAGLQECAFCPNCNQRMEEVCDKVDHSEINDTYALAERTMKFLTCSCGYREAI